MKNEDSHLSDEQLLLDLEGELSPRRRELVQAHFHACWKCRVRRQELENAIVDFVRIHQQDLDAKIPPAAGPRALLKARIAQLSATEPNRRAQWFTVSRGLASVAAICGLLAFGMFLIRSNTARHSPLEHASLDRFDSGLSPHARRNCP